MLLTRNLFNAYVCACFQNRATVNDICVECHQLFVGELYYTVLYTRHRHSNHQLMLLNETYIPQTDHRVDEADVRRRRIEKFLSGAIVCKIQKANAVPGVMQREYDQYKHRCKGNLHAHVRLHKRGQNPRNGTNISDHAHHETSGMPLQVITRSVGAQTKPGNVRVCLRDLVFNPGRHDRDHDSGDMRCDSAFQNQTH